MEKYIYSCIVVVMIIGVIAGVLLSKERSRNNEIMDHESIDHENTTDKY